MVQSGDINRSKIRLLFSREVKDSLAERSYCITHIRCSQNFASHFMATFDIAQV